MRPPCLLFLLAPACAFALPQTYSGTFSGTFTGAVQISGGGSSESPAVPAQCPADHPISCASIGEANWCCASGNTCGWYSGTVGCCPEGQSCYGNGGGGGAGAYSSSWQPSSTYYSSWQPTTTYYQQTSTYYQPTTTVYAQQTSEYQAPPETTTQQQEHAGFCSTITESGPGLPTTYNGDCGTILVVNEAGRERWTGVWWMVSWLVLVHGVGWAVFVLRLEGM